jgi:hypothetical protein
MKYINRFESKIKCIKEHSENLETRVKTLINRNFFLSKNINLFFLTIPLLKSISQELIFVIYNQYYFFLSIISDLAREVFIIN